MNVRPKNIVIIGGGSGIGLATAQKLLDCNIPSIIIASRNMHKLEEARNQLIRNEFQKVGVATIDIAKIDKQNEFIEECDMIHNRPVDGLVISSGVNFDGGNWKGFNITENDWDRIMDINLKGVFFMMRNFTNHLIAKNVKGNICIVSSISAHRDLLGVYQISKNAISGIVHAYGKHLCEKGIVLNCIEPGTTDTGMMPHLKPYTDGIREGKMWNDNSIRRVIRPAEIAENICFLMGENSEILSGTCLLAGGGCKSISK